MEAHWESDSVEIRIYNAGREEAGKLVQKNPKTVEREFTVLGKCGRSLKPQTLPGEVAG